MAHGYKIINSTLLMFSSLLLLQFYITVPCTGTPSTYGLVPFRVLQLKMEELLDLAGVSPRVG